MANPTLKVEISFVSDPLATSPTWVDVTAYLRQDPGISIQRGRQSEQDNFDAGTLRLRLANTDRRFDPSYSSGPYFGNLKPRKQIKVTATYSAVDYIMFQGWVTGWPQSFAPQHGRDAYVDIEAIDAMAWLAENRVPNDLVYSYANSTIGSLALFLRQADASRWSDSTSNGYQAQPMIGTASTAAGIAKGSASSAVALDGSTIWRAARDYVASGNWSISLWFQTTAVAGTIVAGNYVTAPTFQIGVASGGVLQVTVGGAVIAHPSIIVNDGKPHHVVVTGDTSNGAQKLYLDGTLRSSVVPGDTQGLLFDVVGAPDVRSDYTGVTLFQGSVEDIAVFDKQLSAAEVLGLYQRSNGYLEESSTDRITRILDDVGWPASWRTLAVDDDTTLGHSRATVGELVYNARTASELLNEVARTEQGMLFASRDNKVTFRGRYYAQEVTEGKTSQQIFSDDGGATALGYGNFGFAYNDLDMTNDATVTTPTTWAKASDSTSITAHGLQSDKVDTILTTFAAADAMARGLVARGKDPTWRAMPALVYPDNNTSRWDDVLSLELGYRATLEITPMSVGSQNAQDITIEQMEWQITQNQWICIVAGPPVRDVWFICDDSGSLVGGSKVVGY